jgi:hypothetical protein
MFGLVVKENRARSSIVAKAVVDGSVRLSYGARTCRRLCVRLIGILYVRLFGRFAGAERSWARFGGSPSQGEYRSTGDSLPRTVALI